MQLITSAMKGRRALHGVVRAGLLATLVATVAGCSSGDLSDLRQYIEAEKAKPPGRISPVPEFKTYEIFRYSANDRRSPFEQFAEESEVVSAPDTGVSGPDMSRHRETLEGYPLDTLRFVGHLAMGGEQWAIVTSPDAVTHKVRTGNYIGTNFGKIREVTENRLIIDEVVRDSRGAWIEREAALSLID